MVKCVVVACKNYYGGNNKKIRFKPFPNSNDPEFPVWLKLCGQARLNSVKKLVCEAHFPHDIFHTETCIKKRFFKCKCDFEVSHKILPTLNLPTEEQLTYCGRGRPKSGSRCMHTLQVENKLKKTTKKHEPVPVSHRKIEKVKPGPKLRPNITVTTPKPRIQSSEEKLDGIEEFLKLPEKVKKAAVDKPKKSTEPPATNNTTVTEIKRKYASKESPIKLKRKKTIDISSSTDDPPNLTVKATTPIETKQSIRRSGHVKQACITIPPIDPVFRDLPTEKLKQLKPRDIIEKIDILTKKYAIGPSVIRKSRSGYTCIKTSSRPISSKKGSRPPTATPSYVPISNPSEVYIPEPDVSEIEITNDPLINKINYLTKKFDCGPSVIKPPYKRTNSRSKNKPKISYDPRPEEEFDSLEWEGWDGESDSLENMDTCEDLDEVLEILSNSDVNEGLHDASSVTGMDTEPEVFSFDELCRVCAQHKQHTIQIFGVEGKEQKILDKITLCLPVEVQEDDKLPHNICLECKTTLDTSFEFARNTFEAEKNLRNMLEQNQMFQPAEEDGSPETTELLQADSDDDTPQICSPFSVGSELPLQPPPSTQPSYHCTACDLQFKEKPVVARHCYQIHNMHMCEVCCTVFNSKPELTHHYNTTCMKGFKTNDMMVTPSVNPEYKFTCVLCRAELKDVSASSDHGINEHNIHLCPICFYMFPNDDNLQLHLEEGHFLTKTLKHFHLNEKSEPTCTDKVNQPNHVCNKCWKIFFSTELYEHHCKIGCLETQLIFNNKLNSETVVRTKKSVKKFVRRNCRLCQETIPTEYLKSHYKKVHNVYPCIYCKRQYFLKPLLLDIHLKVIHGKVKENSICDYCNLKYTKKSKLRSHIMSNHLKLNKKYGCRPCNELFNLKCEILSHLKKRHRSDTIFMCKICNFITVENNLDLHMKENHKHICNICCVDLKNVSALYSHNWHCHRDKLLLEAKVETEVSEELVLTEECLFCDKKFLKKEYLNVHLELVHYIT